MIRRIVDLLNSTTFRRNVAHSVPLLVALIAAFTWPPERTGQFIEPLMTPIRAVEWSGYDALFHWRGPTPADPRIVVVGFETTTERTIGESWPAPRKLHAQIVRNLVADGAKVICFDVLLAKKSPYGVEDDRAFDAALKEAKGKVVLACRINRGGTDIQKSLITPYYDDKLGIDFEGNSAIASADILRDPDGYVRLLYPLQKFQGEWLPSLPTAAYLALMGGDVQTSKLTRDKIDIAGHAIPRTGPDIIDPEFQENNMGSTYLDFPGGSRTFDFVRYENVLNKEFEPGTFKDKIVFIGVTDIELAGSLNDVLKTAYSHHSPEKIGASFTREVFGVVVQAQMLNSLLQNAFVRMASPLETFVIVFLFSTIANIGVRKFMNWRGPALIALAIVGFVATVFILFVRMRLFVPYIFPSTLILLSTAGVAWLERGEILRRWSANVSPAYLEHMLAHGEDSKPKTCDATVVFGDIRGFTNFSSKHPAELVIDLLDQHLEKQVRIVYEENGTVDKFLGDGIMVVFGAPQKQEDKELRAVRAAWRMRAASFETIVDEKGDKHVLKSGFGIATGDLVLGFVGSRRQYSLTTIGDTVNLSSRLQGVTGDADIVIDRATYDRVKDHFEAEELGPVALKGKDEKIHCWRITGIKDASGGIIHEENRNPPSNL